MTISAVPTRYEFNSTASQTNFAFSFRYWIEADITTYVNGVLKVLSVDYTILPNVSLPGGQIVFNTPLNLNDKVIILRDIVPQRLVDYVQLGKFDAVAVNDDFDRPWAEIQEINTRVDRAFSFADNVFGLTDASIPQPVASAFLAANSAGTALEWAPLIALGAVVGATTSLPGIIELATNAEAQAKSMTDRALTPANLAGLGTTETFAGLIEVATQAETDAGALDTRAITPLKLVTYVNNALAGAGKSITVRQTVLGAPVTSAGLPNFLPGTSGTLNLTRQNVSSTAPFVVVARNGFGASGTVDRIGQSTSNLTWTGLTASNTNYLFVTVDSAGVLTTGQTTVAPVYQWAGTWATTNNLFTFNIEEMVGKVGNGSVATQDYRVYVGEAVTNGSGVTSTVAYALQGKYQSAWTATLPATSTAVAFSHNIGTMEIYTPLLFEAECTTIDNGYAVGDRIQNPHLSAGGAYLRIVPFISSRNSASITTANSGAWYCPPKTGGASVGLTAGSWRYRAKIVRNF